MRFLMDSVSVGTLAGCTAGGESHPAPKTYCTSIINTSRPKVKSVLPPVSDRKQSPDDGAGRSGRSFPGRKANSYGWHHPHGSYPSLISSLRDFVVSLRFRLLMSCTDSQDGLWNFIVFVFSTYVMDDCLPDDCLSDELSDPVEFLSDEPELAELLVEFFPDEPDVPEALEEPLPDAEPDEPEELLLFLDEELPDCEAEFQPDESVISSPSMVDSLSPSL